jgi:hypothetical protein
MVSSTRGTGGMSVGWPARSWQPHDWRMRKLVGSVTVQGVLRRGARSPAGASTSSSVDRWPIWYFGRLIVVSRGERPRAGMIVGGHDADVVGTPELVLPQRAHEPDRRAV